MNREVEAEIRAELRDLPANEVDDLVAQAKVKSDDVEDLDPEVFKAKRDEKMGKIAQANADYGIKSNKT